MVKFTENDLVENKKLREKNLERLDVLDKVGNIILFPNTESMTTKLVSRYYEIEVKTLQKVIERNKKELELNGMVLKSHAEIKEILKADDVSTLEIPRRGTYFFSKRAVLNIGMLLTESEIALEVRNQILNGFEQLSDEQKTQGITDEQLLLLNIIQSDSVESRAVHLSEYNNFKNRHINQLNERIDEMKPKEEAFETFINSDGYQTINQASKTLNMGRNKLYEFLRENKVLMSDNTPYQRYVDQEYFVVKQNSINKGNFSKIHPQTFITAKGIDYVSKLLKKNKSQ